MDRRHHGSVHEIAVGQGQEVEAVVNDVELVGPLEDRGDVQALGDLRIDARGRPTIPGGSTLQRLAAVCESPVAKSVTSCPRLDEPFGEQ